MVKQNMNILRKFNFWYWFLLPYYVSGESYFTAVSTDGKEQTLTTYSNIKSKVNCALMCDADYNAECRGFKFETNTSICRLYQGTIEPEDGSGYFVYRKNSDCEFDGFQLIEMDELKLCYKFVETGMTFANARSHCQSMNSYLLNIDDIREYNAAESLSLTGVTVTGWVGLNDIDNEGVWVNDRDGTPINPSLLVWRNSEPNNSGYNEDCAQIVFGTQAMNDKGCGNLHAFFCEKDVLF